MRYILFDDFNSAQDFGLIYLDKTIGAPELKSSYISIPGGDGMLDYSEFYGGPHYGNRTITMNFASIERSYGDRMATDAAVKNALHGQRRKIVFDNQPGFYYMARITVGDWANVDGVGYLTIYGDAEPWKYKTTETVVVRSGSGPVTLHNLRMPVTPRISATAAATLTWDGHSVALQSGTGQIVPALTLSEGDTNITIATDGDISFAYREGGF